MWVASYVNRSIPDTPLISLWCRILQIIVTELYLVLILGLRELKVLIYLHAVVGLLTHIGVEGIVAHVSVLAEALVIHFFLRILELLQRSL